MISVVKGKCPKCRKGNMFIDPNPYKFSKIFMMPENCECCGLKFNREPGFFYGSMYVGYGLSIAYLVAVYVAMVVLLNEFEIEAYLLLGIGSLVVLTPVIFRLSRSIWLFMFTKYDSQAGTNCNK
ncbi:MAG: DUF983 domain-containing protein [Salibacteraceae bacterium]